MTQPDWSLLGRTGGLPHFTAPTPWNSDPNLHPDNNQYSNQSTTPLHGTESMFSHAAAASRLPVALFAGSSAQDHSLQWLQETLSAAPMVESASTNSMPPPSLFRRVAEAPTHIEPKSGKRKQAPRSKPKRAQEWESHKEIIEEIYMRQKKSLEEVREFMKDKHQFEASTKQYKTQFQTWRWRRNLPQEHAVFMEAKARWREQEEGKQTEFEWCGQKWPIDRVQRSLRKELVNNGQQTILDVKTPSDIDYNTPLGEPSPRVTAPSNESARTGRNMRTTPPSTATFAPIRVRWNGHTAADLDKLRQMARELIAEDDSEGAEATYRAAFDAAKHLLPLANEGTAALAYELAIFYARNDDMKNADDVLDDLTMQFNQRWGNAHELTMKHYAVVGRLLSIWDRHQDSINILKRMTDNLSTSIMPSRAEGPSQVQTPRSTNAETYVHMANPVAVSSIGLVAGTHQETHPSQALAVLRQQIELDRVFEFDGDETPDRLIIELIDSMEKAPEENLTDIVRARCLLITFYDKADLHDAGDIALDAAEGSVLSLCKLECRMPKGFFDVSIDLARILLQCEQTDRAEQLLERIEARFVEALGDDHPDTVSLLIRIGKMYQGFKRWVDAEPRFEQAYAACLTRFGSSGFVTKTLERCLEMKRYSYAIPSEDNDDLVCTVGL